MTTTTNFGITLLEASQAQKEITINQALNVLDAAVLGSVVDKDLATPPTSPATNALYIVAGSPTGAWAGKAGCLAYFNQVWNFITPTNGARTWVRDESLYYQFNGTSWAASGGGGGGSGGGSGDMLKATYDAANISQQVVGTSATQTLTNKTINGASNALTVRLANDVTGALPVANGGSGQTSYTDGQILIGNSTGNTLSKATLTAGAGISITNGAGAITITATGGGSGGGSGDMLKATYDAANIAQQVVGTTATQTITNKTINGASNALTVRLANDVTGTLPVANGGTGDTGTAWTSYSPTLSANTGTFTNAAASGRYKTIGKTVFIQVTITIVTNGSAAINTVVSLPKQAAAANFVLAGREGNMTGQMISGVIFANSNYIIFSRYDNAYMGGNGYLCILSGVYESV